MKETSDEVKKKEQKGTDVVKQQRKEQKEKRGDFF